MTVQFSGDDLQLSETVEIKAVNKNKYLLWHCRIHQHCESYYQTLSPLLLTLSLF